VLSVLIRAEESLGRYLTESGHIIRQKNEVKYKAFMPPRNLHLSVYRIDGLRLDEIWDIGQNKVIKTMPQPRKLYGVADIKARVVEEAQLTIVPDKTPSLHANIVGWPEAQAAQLSIAQELAAEAKLILKE
jgi:hypothetical protein